MTNKNKREQEWAEAKERCVDPIATCNRSAFAYDDLTSGTFRFRLCQLLTGAGDESLRLIHPG